MDGPDPTTASGWGVGVFKPAATTNLGALRLEGAAGTWTILELAAGANRSGEMTIVQSNSAGLNSSARVDSTTGISIGGASQAAVVGISGAAPVYLCAWIGTTDGLIAAGNYDFRVLAGLQDLPTADFTGRA